MSFNRTPERSNFWIRTGCLVPDCGWWSAWVQRPGEAVSSFAEHLAHEHPAVLADPSLFKSHRKDEFHYGATPPSESDEGLHPKGERGTIEDKEA